MTYLSYDDKYIYIYKDLIVIVVGAEGTEIAFLFAVGIMYSWT